MTPFITATGRKEEKLDLILKAVVQDGAQKAQALDEKYGRTQYRKPPRKGRLSAALGKSGTLLFQLNCLC